MKKLTIVGTYRAKDITEVVHEVNFLIESLSPVARKFFDLADRKEENGEEPPVPVLKDLGSNLKSLIDTTQTILMGLKKNHKKLWKQVQREYKTVEKRLQDVTFFAFTYLDRPEKKPVGDQLPHIGYAVDDLKKDLIMLFNAMDKLR